MSYLLIFLLSLGVFAADKTKKAAAPTPPAPAGAEKGPAEKAPGAPEKYKADVFDLEGKEPFFTYEAERTYTGDKMNYTATFKDLQGEVVAEEKAELDKGVIVRFESERKPTREKGLIEVRDGRMYFTYTERGDKKTKWAILQPDTVLSANFTPFIESHWNDLMAKKPVKFNYAVWYRMETVGFQFTHDSETANEVVFKMAPTNLFYRSLVNPLFITYDKKSKRLLTLKGRTLPKIKKGNSWRDFDALIKYHY